MSATVDANLLLYATDESSRFHAAARARLGALARGPAIVSLFWPVGIACLRLSTHPAIFDASLSPEQAIENIGASARAPAGADSRRAGAVLGDVSRRRNRRPRAGSLVANTHVVALMRENGVRALWTHDRDYRRLFGIEVLDPFPSSRWPAGSLARTGCSGSPVGGRRGSVVGSLRARADERSAVG